MKIRDRAISFSATDLANHLSCTHLTQLDLQLTKGEIAVPSWDNPHLRVLQQRGLEHERAYITSLRAKGLSVLDLSGERDEKATWEAMKSGAQAIVQPSFANEEWSGRADVLLRVEQPERANRLGNWSYEVVDCKLACDTKAETILQLCLYSEFVAKMQGLEPELFHVIRPHVGFEPESYRLAAFGAYYRLVKKALQDAAKNGGGRTYPEPVSHCDICRWWKECDRQRRRDDHLSFVAGASRLQRKELLLQGVTRLEVLGRLPIPIPFKPARGSPEGYTRIREQARIQVEARTGGQLKFELLRSETDEGLFRLPVPSAGDIFLDLEGDPFVGEGGLEYLFGVLTASEDGNLGYQNRWALDRAPERAAFEWFIDLTLERMIRFPDLHIYHFGSYEPGAIKRLMLRYATREEEVDRLLRGGIFIDLHGITKQAVRASVEQYSLKDMEKFCDYQRCVPLPEANQARHFVEHQLELIPSPTLSDEARSTVDGYNEDDCRATERLRHWLEGLRDSVTASGTEVPRPEARDGRPTEERTSQRQRVAALFDALTRDLPAEPKDRTGEQAARWLLAHALDWHWREEKVKWWEFFRMKELSEEDLFDEKAAVAGLTIRQRMPRMSAKERAPVDQYEYPSQECAIRAGDTLYTLDEQKFGDVVAADPVARTIDVKKPMKLHGFHATCAFAHSRYPAKEQSESILRLAQWIVEHGIEGSGEYQAARDLLLRNSPRLSAGQALLSRPNETVVQRACRIALALDHSALPIQGPPGAGKTFTAARMICELVRNGKKVGITAVSHKVIRKLLDEVVKAASQMSLAGISCAHRKEDADPEGRPVREIGANAEALARLQSGAVNVLGGTPWLWCREEFRGSIHSLFVDEAGQMSLANVLACSPAGKCYEIG